MHNNATFIFHCIDSKISMNLQVLGSDHHNDVVYSDELTAFGEYICTCKHLPLQISKFY